MQKLSLNDFESTYKTIGCEDAGAKILASKSEIHTILLKNLHVGAANILKQDALSIGADLAVPKGAILCDEKYVDAILIASTKHLKILSKKELAQPFGLKQIAKELKKFIYPPQKNTKIMGIINANDDSFYAQSRFKNSNAIVKIEEFIKDGANIIDIGGVSSRPNSLKVSTEDELQRVKPILNSIQEAKIYENIIFSIDSYNPVVVKYALDCGFKIVNDITGLEDDEVCNLVSKYDATAIIMHMQNRPENMQENPKYDNLFGEIDSFFAQRVEKANSFGIKKIVLDVGIGFGKTLKHNLQLLKHHNHFRHFGYELLIGASRKSLIDKITPSSSEGRLSGTLAIHLEAIKQGASIIRCHDVKEHFQAIKVQEAILNS